MNTMPSGQYITGTSMLHRLDARGKLICMFVLLTAVILTSTLWGYIFIIAVTAALMLFSALPAAALFTPLRRLWLFFTVIFLMNALFFDGNAPLCSWWIFHITAAGLSQGAQVVLRVLLVVLLSNILTCTTRPMELTGALESLFKPLKLFHIPVEDIAMILSVAIQFIPTLSEEADMIKKAQTARGARFESRRLTDKAASVAPLVVPIFLSAFRRADELSMAMEARGYRNAGSRTKKDRHALHLPDYLALTASMMICAASVFIF